MADLNIRLEIRVTPAIFRWGLIGALLCVMATQVSSESVTLFTYYPAPSGVYSQMLTTDNTWLARDKGQVGIGTANPAGKLDVEGVGGVSLNAGSVGIGKAPDASYALDVNGTVNATAVRGCVYNP